MALLVISGFLLEFAAQTAAPGAAGGGTTLALHLGVDRLQAGVLIEIPIHLVRG